MNIAGSGGSALAVGRILRIKFNNCTGAVASPAESFLRTVLSATGPFLNPVNGVRCYAVLG